MDKNQVIGFILIFAVLLGWTMLTKPSDEELAARKAQLQQDSLAQVEANIPNLNQKEAVIAPPHDVQAQDSAYMENLKYSYGTFANAAVGEEEILTLENADLKLTFSSKGGFIKEALVKGHEKVVTNQDGEDITEPLLLLEDEKNIFSYQLPLNGPLSTIETHTLNFSGKKQGNSVVMQVTGSGGETFTQTYTLADKGFGIDYQVSYQGFNSNTPLQLKWNNYLDHLEKNITFEKRYSTIYYKEKEDDDADYCSCTGDDEETFEGKKLEWVSHSNQFFNTSLISDEEGFSEAVLETVMLSEDNEDLKLVKSSFALPDNDGIINMKMYLGPNEYNNLVAYDNELEEVIPFGNSIFGTINRHLIRPFFNFLSGFIGSKGLVIIALIFIIKMALYPLMYKMLYSQAKMGALKPELAKLKEKFKDEPQKQSMEQMKIYREYGVSPLGGCLPMILQMPIWYALFRFFPASITFRQESFLWADDLSSYDVITQLPFEIPFFGDHLSLFTLLWAVSTVAYTYYNTKHMDMSANPAMKYVQYFMPVMFLGFFNSYASGLTCYMLFSNLFNIAQTVITKNFIFDEDKIRDQLLKNKENPKKKKKGGFQARLEQAMKQQQNIAAQQKAAKKKK